MKSQQSNYILISWGTGILVHQLEKDCPLWLLIANVILIELNKLGFLVFDDFSFIFTSHRSLGLEIAVRQALAVFLQLHTSKSA